MTNSLSSKTMAQQLREAGEAYGAGGRSLWFKAADEIERLRAALQDGMRQADAIQAYGISSILRRGLGDETKLSRIDYNRVPPDAVCTRCGALWEDHDCHDSGCADGFTKWTGPVDPASAPDCHK